MGVGLAVGLVGFGRSCTPRRLKLLYPRKKRKGGLGHSSYILPYGGNHCPLPSARPLYIHPAWPCETSLHDKKRDTDGERFGVILKEEENQIRGRRKENFRTHRRAQGQREF